MTNYVTNVELINLQIVVDPDFGESIGEQLSEFIDVLTPVIASKFEVVKYDSIEALVENIKQGN